jgi:hypothetical protein
MAGHSRTAMKTKRLLVIGCLLACLELLVVARRFWPANEPTYQGKPDSVWFKEYVFTTNGPCHLLGMTSLSAGTFAVHK